MEANQQTSPQQNEKVFKIYAALGELHTKTKQLNQIKESYALKIEKLEQLLVQLINNPLTTQVIKKDRP